MRNAENPDEPHAQAWECRETLDTQTTPAPPPAKPLLLSACAWVRGVTNDGRIVSDSGRHHRQPPVHATREEIACAAEALRGGGLVAFPTETVYGLGADALNAQAVARVFSLKGRPSHNPLIVHVLDEAMARTLARDWPMEASVLARAYWPGPLTLVLAKSERVPSIVTGGGGNVAIRVPAHPVALELIRGLGGPIVGPSANPSGRVSPTSAEHVCASFAGGRGAGAGAWGASSPLVVLEGGACAIGLESSVVSLVDPSRPVLLRPGLVSAESIERLLGVTVVAAVSHADVAAGSATKSLAPLESPGMLDRHYAPATPAMLVASEGITRSLAMLPPGSRVGVLAWSGVEVPPPHERFEMPKGLPGYAAALYAMMRVADDRGLSRLFIELPPSAETGHEGLARALADRLRRATHEGS